MTAELTEPTTDNGLGRAALEGRLVARPGPDHRHAACRWRASTTCARWLDGTLPPPPISGLMEFTMVAAEPGEVVFTCRPDESAYNPIGAIHGGLVCTLLDSVAGCALHSTLPAGQGLHVDRDQGELPQGRPPRQRPADRHRHGGQGRVARRLHRGRRHRRRRRRRRHRIEHAAGLRPVSRSATFDRVTTADPRHRCRHRRTGDRRRAATARPRRDRPRRAHRHLAVRASASGPTRWPRSTRSASGDAVRERRRPGHRGRDALARRHVAAPARRPSASSTRSVSPWWWCAGRCSDRRPAPVRSPPGTVETGLAATGLVVTADGVRVTLSDGDDPRRRRGRRRRRRRLDGGAPPQRPAAQPLRRIHRVAWGRRHAALDPALAGETMGAGTEFGHVPLGPRPHLLVRHRTRTRRQRRAPGASSPT